MLGEYGKKEHNIVHFLSTKITKHFFTKEKNGAQVWIYELEYWDN
jgi:hypothetical protein